MFSLIWSIGATCDNDGRTKFSEWIRKTMHAEKLKMQFPKAGLVYDYFLDDGGIFNKEDEDKGEDEQQKAKIVSLTK